MKPRHAIVSFFVLLVAIIALWRWSAPANQVVSASPAVVAKPVTHSAPTTPKTPASTVLVSSPPQKNDRVALPVLPPQTTKAAPGAKPGDKPQGLPLTDTEERKVKNNLRQFSAASQQYMIEMGRTQVGYFDIVGTSTDAYIRSLQSVAGENYEDLIVTQTQTEIAIVAPDGTNITFEQ